VDCVPYVYRKTNRAEPEIATPLHTESCDFFYLAPEVRLEPKAEDIVKPADTRRKRAKTLYLQGAQAGSGSMEKEKTEDQEQYSGTNMHVKYVPFMYASEIARIAEAWEVLSEKERRKIMDIVDGAVPHKRP
jgi:hypothetical protein